MVRARFARLVELSLDLRSVPPYPARRARHTFISEGTMTAHFVAVPPSGGRGGSTPGEVWTTATVHAYFCEGVSPFGEWRRFARGHTDITRGTPYLKKLWRRKYPP